jgi:alkyldihydroxyacetonephosphate synthase
MLRLSDARETETTLKLAGRERILAWADRVLSTIGYRDERCLMIFGVTGGRRDAAFTRRRVKSISRHYGGLSTGRFIGNQWRKSRFRSAYLRNSLWENGYAVDTLETAVSWSAVRTMAAGLIGAIEKASKGLDKPVLAFAHLSHVYNDGASIYVTYLFPRSATPEETLQHWQVMKDRASQFIIHKGGTISHQHGVGIDHASYMKDEKSETGSGTAGSRS